MSMLIAKSIYDKKVKKKERCQFAPYYRNYIYIFTINGYNVIHIQGNKALEVEKLCINVFCSNFVTGPTCPF